MSNQTLSKEILKKTVQYQLRQFHHDNRYYVDVVALSIPNRMKHITLHLAKYSYDISKFHQDRQISKSFVDAFIIIVSAANLLKIELANLDITKEANANILNEYLKNLSILSKACEAYDHFENHPYHSKWIEAIQNLYLAFIKESLDLDEDIFDKANLRLDEIEAKA